MGDAVTTGWVGSFVKVGLGVVEIILEGVDGTAVTAQPAAKIERLIKSRTEFKCFIGISFSVYKPKTPAR